MGGRIGTDLAGCDGDTARGDRKRREFTAAAYVYQDDHIQEIAERISKANFRINGLIWRDLRRIGYDVSDKFSNFTKPVLVIQGREDILRESTARKAADTFPNAELVLLKRCGHYGWLDRPDRYFKEIFSFGEKVRNYNSGR